MKSSISQDVAAGRLLLVFVIVRGSVCAEFDGRIVKTTVRFSVCDAGFYVSRACDFRLFTIIMQRVVRRFTGGDSGLETCFDLNVTLPSLPWLLTRLIQRRRLGVNPGDRVSKKW